MIHEDVTSAQDMDMMYVVYRLGQVAGGEVIEMSGSGVNDVRSAV